MNLAQQIGLESFVCSVPLWLIWYRLDEAKFREVIANVLATLGGVLGLDEDSNGFLILLGLGLVGIAIAGLFARLDAGLSGTFLSLGVAVTVFGVVEGRVEGNLEMGPDRFSFFVRRKAKKRAKASDEEVRLDAMIPVDNVLERGR